MKKQNDIQQITKAKGRPMLTWVGKHPLEKVEWYPAQEKEVYGVKNATEFNKLFWGDNLQVLSHLLKDYRGKIDLIYIDPPFDSKADYVRKVKIKGEKIDGQQQNLLEEKQYTDIWEKDEYLQFMFDRLLIMKELLANTGSLFLHCDFHKVHHLRCLLDEIFGEENFRNDIVWFYPNKISRSSKEFPKFKDNILFYTKNVNNKFNEQKIVRKEPVKQSKRIWQDKKNMRARDKVGNVIYEMSYDITMNDVWDIPIIGSTSSERETYPTQKPETLLERIIQSSSDEGDLIMDCFCGSGTTMAVAQKLGRRWIGCDINIGAIQTSTKRIAQAIEEQEKANNKLIKDDFKGSMAFKIYNVNDYDIFKNEIEAKEIVMETYGVEAIKRSQFDGVLDNKFVKIMSLNKVLNKLDIQTVLKNIEGAIDNFTPKITSKGREEIYEEGVIIICSGAELDAEDFLKKENKTGVKVVIRDILNDKKSLIFKKKPEARIEVKAKDKKLSVVIKQFYSPILMRKLELENEKVIEKKTQTKVEDFKQIIDSVAIDVDYDGSLFNAEIIDLPDKKGLVKAEYSYTYEKSGKNTIAIKIVDVLGEEYFETFKVSA